MFKHIFGQAIFQLIILCIFLFGGEYFLPEFEDAWDDELKSKFALSRKNGKDGLADFPWDHWWEPKYHDASLSRIRSGRLLSYNGTDKEYYHV